MKKKLVWRSTWSRFKARSLYIDNPEFAFFFFFSKNSLNLKIYSTDYVRFWKMWNVLFRGFIILHRLFHFFLLHIKRCSTSPFVFALDLIESYSFKFYSSKPLPTFIICFRTCAFHLLKRIYFYRRRFTPCCRL